MDKIAVMGDYDSIYGFAALGLSTFPVDNLETAKKRLSTLVNSGYGIIQTDLCGLLLVLHLTFYLTQTGNL